MNFGDNRGWNKDAISQGDEGAKQYQFSRNGFEALKTELLDALKINFPTWIRPVIREELQHQFSKMALEGWRVASLQTESESTARKFHLQFTKEPAAKTFAQDNILDKDGDALCVKLVHAKTGKLVFTGPESVAKLEVVPLVGDFNHTEEQGWTADEFDKHVAVERENKGHLLVGDREIRLQGGMGTLGQISFTDNSSFVRSKQFRLGVRVAAGNDCGPLSIREGKSQAFNVRDKRGKPYNKHDTPDPTDDVWRLQNIKKDGPYHTKLKQKGIHTVKQFLSCFNTSPELLREMLGKMSKDAYEATVDHAKKCCITLQCDTLYACRPLEQPAYLSYDGNYPVVGAVGQHHLRLDLLDGTQQHLQEQEFSVNEFLTAEWGGSTSAGFGGGAAAPAIGWPADHDMVQVADAQDPANITSVDANGIAGLEFFDAEEFLVFPQDAQGERIENSSLSRREPSNEIVRSPSIGPDVWEMVYGLAVEKPPLPIDSKNQGPAGNAIAAYPADRRWLRIGSLVRCGCVIIRLAAELAERRSPPRKYPKVDAGFRHRMREDR